MGSGLFDGYKKVSLRTMLEEIGEDDVKKILSNFSCPLNLDVEYYLKQHAIEFDKISRTPTTLIFRSYQGQSVLVGYFSLTNKSIDIPYTILSNSMRKKVAKYSDYVHDIHCYRLPSPLIAQLGKNFNNGYNKLITGDELLKMACDRVALSFETVGGKIAYIECEDSIPLINFYSNNGFIEFGRRDLDKDEHERIRGNYLVQMFKIFKSKPIPKKSPLQP